MTLIDQITAAIVSHALEWGEAPSYVDAATDVFRQLSLAAMENKAANCIIVGQMAVFNEPTCRSKTIRVVSYTRQTEPVEVDIRVVG